ncbi:MAG: hypothetical protein MK102_17500 [Fuerstiella sp.]|nr:hypothetical protein [Fuerstiella sp.]
MADAPQAVQPGHLDKSLHPPPKPHVFDPPKKQANKLLLVRLLDENTEIRDLSTDCHYPQREGFQEDHT